MSKTPVMSISLAALISLMLCLVGCDTRFESLVDPTTGNHKKAQEVVQIAYAMKEMESSGRWEVQVGLLDELYGVRFQNGESDSVGWVRSDDRHTTSSVFLQIFDKKDILPLTDNLKMRYANTLMRNPFDVSADPRGANFLTDEMEKCMKSYRERFIIKDKEDAKLTKLLDKVIHYEVESGQEPNRGDWWRLIEEIRKHTQEQLDERSNFEREIRRESVTRLRSEQQKRLEQILRKEADLLASAEVKWFIPTAAALIALMVPVIFYWLLKMADKPDSLKILIESRVLIEVSGICFLLSIILLLALSEMLSKETTATLLGAISGYVLGSGRTAPAASASAPKG